MQFLRQSSPLHRTSGKKLLTRHYYLVFFRSEHAKMFLWKDIVTSSCGYLKLASTMFVLLPAPEVLWNCKFIKILQVHQTLLKAYHMNYMPHKHIYVFIISHPSFSATIFICFRQSVSLYLQNDSSCFLSRTCVITSVSTLV